MPHLSSLGFVLTPGGIQVDPDKTMVVGWPTPHSHKQLQCFLGFANLCRCSIHGLSTAAAPLHCLMSSNLTFKCNPEAETAFKKINQRFTTVPILILPDPKNQFPVEVDTLDGRAILSQKSESDNNSIYVPTLLDESPPLNIIMTWEIASSWP